MTVYSNLRIWDGVADDYADADAIAVRGWPNRRHRPWL